MWTCERLGLERASIGLMVVGPDEMAAINGEHRDKPDADRRAGLPGGRPRRISTGRPTGPPPELGDVIICPEAAQEPLETLAVHGLLHLLGYDHEVDDGRDARPAGPPGR